jgi:uncharacterized protein (TIGR02646 family)
MEKITKPSISNIPTLTELSNNYIQWSKDFAEKLKKDGKSSTFAWKSGLYNELRNQLCFITKEHCTFCDAFPVGHISKETIEHYFPKEQYPLKSYDWDNLFYCCDKCQSEANKIKFIETLKPDTATYKFSNYFYFDLGSGKINVLENLETENLEAFDKANAFLIRYGINSDIRKTLRKTIYQDIQNHFAAKTIKDDFRQRDDFTYRYVYDHYVKNNQ